MPKERPPQLLRSLQPPLSTCRSMQPRFLTTRNIRNLGCALKLFEKHSFPVRISPQMAAASRSWATGYFKRLEHSLSYRHPQVRSRRRLGTTQRSLSSEFSLAWASRHPRKQTPCWRSKPHNSHSSGIARTHRIRSRTLSGILTSHLRPFLTFRLASSSKASSIIPTLRSSSKNAHSRCGRHCFPVLFRAPNPRPKRLHSHHPNPRQSAHHRLILPFRSFVPCAASPLILAFLRVSPASP